MNNLCAIRISNYVDIFVIYVVIDDILNQHVITLNVNVTLIVYSYSYRSFYLNMKIYFMEMNILMISRHIIMARIWCFYILFKKRISYTTKLKHMNIRYGACLIFSLQLVIDGFSLSPKICAQFSHIM